MYLSKGEIMLDKQFAKPEYRHRTLENGVYISPIGVPYISMNDWMRVNPERD